MNLDQEPPGTHFHRALVQMVQETEDSVKRPAGLCIPDGGPSQLQGCVENGTKSISERKTLWCPRCALQCRERFPCKENHFLCLGSDGGFMIPIHSEMGKDMRVQFERLVSWYGRQERVPGLHRGQCV